jgi:hypothetical protein
VAKDKRVKFVKEVRKTADGRNLDTWTVHPDSRDELERQMNDVLRNAFGLTLDELREQVEKEWAASDEESLGRVEAVTLVKEIWPEAEGFESNGAGWTYRVGGGYGYVTGMGYVCREPQGTRQDAIRFLSKKY